MQAGRKGPCALLLYPQEPANRNRATVRSTGAAGPPEACSLGSPLATSAPSLGPWARRAERMRRGWSLDQASSCSPHGGADQGTGILSSPTASRWPASGLRWERRAGPLALASWWPTPTPPARLFPQRSEEMAARP